MEPALVAVSDLHIGYPENREILAGIRPSSDEDWLVVAGDVADQFADVEWALTLLSERFAQVTWAPGNHELWTPHQDPVQLRGEHRYDRLIEMCRSMGVRTPEDPYARWDGPGGPLTIAPLFVGYDYSFRTPSAPTREAALAQAYEAGVVCTDEMLLHPDPHPSRDAWCRARVALTEERLAECDPTVPTVLVNHYPLVRDPTRVLRYPEFAQWCGTDLTADWHTRFNAAVVIYRHLHIPRITWHDGVRFEEVSLGYPREWRARTAGPQTLRPVVRG